ncbi:MAG: hypothetical protein ACYS15_20845, partial [Planctomycetota bacterium]
MARSGIRDGVHRSFASRKAGNSGERGKAASNKSRGRRAKTTATAADASNSGPTPTAHQARRRWAALIRQVWKVDPLVCPRCGGPIKIVSFINPDQRDVIDNILTHGGLASRAPPPEARGPPAPSPKWPGQGLFQDLSAANPAIRAPISISHQHARGDAVTHHLPPALSAGISGVESRLLSNFRRTARRPRSGGPAHQRDSPLALNLGIRRQLAQTVRRTKAYRYGEVTQSEIVEDDAERGMRVLCVEINGSSRPERYIAASYTRESRYDLSRRVEYIVYGFWAMNQEGWLVMTPPYRPCWQNCAVKADAEMQAIDRMEDAIAPIDPALAKVRGLITGLELCHHKAERWVANIIEAIGRGETTKGLGTRSSQEEHPAERVWQNACAALSAWCAGRPIERIDLSVGDIRASELVAGLGERSPLKEWQVQRVIEKIRSSIHWPRPLEDPTARYVWLLLEVG